MITAHYPRRSGTRRARLALAATAAIVGLTLAPLAAAPAFAGGNVLQVGGPDAQYSTISAAVNAASNGDTIDVAAGTYNEDVYVDKYITIAGSAGVYLDPPSDNSSQAPLFIQNVPTMSGESTVISGLTISNPGTSQDGQGGAVSIFNASPTLENNVIENSTGGNYGGGVLINDNSNPLLFNNTIKGNRASQGGGGIMVQDGSSPEIIGNTITGNTTSGWTGASGGGSSGAGIYLGNNGGTGNTTPVILDNTISNNTADFAGGGIMNTSGVNAIVQDNVITGNSAAYGGGIHIEAVGNTPYIGDNTITGNSAVTTNHSDGGHGGAISIYNQSQPTIVGNTIENNTAQTDGAGITAAENSTSTITANLIENNTLTGSGQNDGAGLFAADSTFVATNNVFAGNSGGVGGALNIEYEVNATVANNTIVNNLENQVDGGAIFVGNMNGTVIIANNILTENQGYQVFEQSTSTSRMDNNLLGPASSAAADGYGQYWNDADHSLTTTAGKSNIATNIPKDTGNIGGSAGFTNYASGDFSLTSTSAAIDGGTTNLGGSLTIPLDIRGVARTGAYDIGAYEYAADPIVTTDPVLSGTPQVSSTLSVTPGSGWGEAPSTISYQWLSDGAPVNGATASTYSPHLSDVGNTLSVTVTATYDGVFSQSITTPVTATVTRGPYFADVPFGSTFSTPIEWMAAEGYSTGTPNPPYAPLYKPNDPVSREAMAAFLYRLSGVTFTPPSTPTFADVDSSNPFYTAIEWMASAGISTGTPQQSGLPLFQPTNAVSRQAMAFFLARYDNVDISTPPTVQSFADVPIDASSAAAIGWMASSGVSTGTPQPSGLPLYKPSDPVSRQAMAAFLYRLPAPSAPTG